MAREEQEIKSYNLREHDIIRATSVVEVVDPEIREVYVNGVYTPTVLVRDADTNHQLNMAVDFGTNKLTLVHRPKRKPPVGTVIGAQELYDTFWKRGTLFQSRSHFSSNPSRTYVVTASGYLYDTQRKNLYTFDSLLQANVLRDGKYEILYYPDED